MVIRIARPEDDSAIWSIIEPCIRASETHTLDRDMTKEDALAYRGDLDEKAHCLAWDSPGS